MKKKKMSATRKAVVRALGAKTINYTRLHVKPKKEKE